MTDTSNTARVGDLSVADLNNIVREAIRDELSTLGFDLNDPKERVEAIQDALFVRSFRKLLKTAAYRVGYSVLMAALAGAMLLAGYGNLPEKFR